MRGTNVLFGQIAVVFGIVIAGVWAATQWTAAALCYQVRLGSPWFDFLGTPVYHPWRLFEWWFFFDAYAPRVFDIGGAIAGGSGLVAVLVAIGMSIWRSRQSRLVTTYGSARWANAEDIRKAGLTQPAGVFLGQHDRQYLRHEGPEHVLTFAPTRSGKGVGLVVPTLLSWPASAVIHDIKGENWQITAAGARASRIACCSTRRMRSRRPTTRCWRCGAERMKCATYRTSRTSWSIPKARWSDATTGRRLRTRCWSAPSCMCSMRARTRRCAASPTSSPTLPARSS
uniref:Conjugative transmembrane protein n=1 Tax=Achromobacter denitrificans TaxID=32002 RepID=A0A0P0UWN7_ACHDE|nr:conjugative transmembrane protein [Achromobacter denitrificans]